MKTPPSSGPTMPATPYRAEQALGAAAFGRRDEGTDQGEGQDDSHMSPDLPYSGGTAREAGGYAALIPAVSWSPAHVAAAE